MVDFIIGGWEVSGVYSYYSGMFLTPLWSGPDPTGTALSRPVRLRPMSRFGQTTFGTPIFPVISAALTDGSMPALLRLRRSGRFGTSATGVIKGPHVNVWHMGFFKSFPIRERARFRYEATATNFFNHPNYNNPATNISQLAAVGVITGTGASPWERRG